MEKKSSAKYETNIIEKILMLCEGEVLTILKLMVNGLLSSSFW